MIAKDGKYCFTKFDQIQNPTSTVAQCLTRDRRDGSRSLTGGSALCPLARHINPNQPRKTHPDMAEKILTGM